MLCPIEKHEARKSKFGRRHCLTRGPGTAEAYIADLRLGGTAGSVCIILYTFF